MRARLEFEATMKFKTLLTIEFYDLLRFACRTMIIYFVNIK